MEGYRLDPGHAITADTPPVPAPRPARPRTRFGPVNRPDPCYRVLAALYLPGDDEPGAVEVLHECSSLKTALAIAAGESLSADLGADVTDVLVTSPDGEHLHRYAVAVPEAV